MTNRLLPDRERRHLLQFYVWPKLDYGRRWMIAGILIVAGLTLQLLLPTRLVLPFLIVTVPLLLFGNLFLLVRGYNLTPDQLFGGTWEKTTRDRFREVREMEKRVNQWDETFADVTCLQGLVFLVMVGGVIALVVFMLSQSTAMEHWAIVFAVDAGVLLLPHWFTGTRRAWRPVSLKQQIDSLETALAVIERQQSLPCQIQPMFQMAGQGDRRTPVAVRVFIRFPDGPEDFLGLQFQVSINDVQGTKHPYLYAVVVARKSFHLLSQHLAETRKICTGLTVEQSQEEDVEVIVIRQKTTKTSGYQTKPTAITRIATAAWNSTAHMLAGIATV